MHVLCLKNAFFFSKTPLLSCFSANSHSHLRILPTQYFGVMPSKVCWIKMKTKISLCLNRPNFLWLISHNEGGLGDQKA